MKKIILVAGARPNFMKIAPILRQVQKHDVFSPIIIHTGQHYDENMSSSFFSSLEMRDPDYYLRAGSASHAVQTATIMVEFEKVALKEKPDLVIVVGDVNSTIAAGLVATKLGIPLAHVEAGLRSRDRTMPEEINRIATDAISDIFFTTEEEATNNLVTEGHTRESIYFVGHVMVDNLLYQLRKLGDTPPSEYSAHVKSLLPEEYICLTMHRPSNVDDRETLTRLLQAINTLSNTAPVIFPCHPRTHKQIRLFGLDTMFQQVPDEPRIKIERGLFITHPLDYNDFLYLWKDATLMITDSGGLQEETTARKIPCITIRETTERPVTVEIGSNVVVGTDVGKIVTMGLKALAGQWKTSAIPSLWDGSASKRIVDVLTNIFYERRL